MSIGAESMMYPFKLASKQVWAKGAKIINCSLPGFTSTDACRFFFEQKNTFGTIGAVVIYLGNCDTMASELPKLKHSLFRSLVLRIKKCMGSGIKKIKLKNRFLYFEWNSDFDQDIESPVSLDIFEENIARILNYCHKKRIRTVLVRPEAHIMFPSGSGKGNYVFYNYLGLNPVLSKLMVADDPRLIDAARMYEDCDFNKAAEIYENMLLKPHPEKKSLEYQSLLVNNYATCQANLGNLGEADFLLSLLLKERDVRQEIIRFNLSMVYKMQGDESEFSLLLNKAYESDSSMYRVREPYKIVIDRLAERYKDTKIFDLRNVVNDDDFIDHCHPLPDAQIKISDGIYKLLDIPELRGKESMEIDNRLYNPEYSLGNDSEFYQYFKTYSKMTKRDIQSELSELRNKLSTSSEKEAWPAELIDELSSDLSKALTYYQRHPMYPYLIDAIEAEPHQSIDIGRFPEFFLCRKMVPFLKYMEAQPEICNLFSEKLNILRRSNQLLSILPPGIEKTNGTDLSELSVTKIVAWRERILIAVREGLFVHLSKGNQIEFRLKTTIFWYFRESLRFGSHSRISMRYDRVTLEFIAEALAVVLVLGHLAAVTKGEVEEVKELIKLLENTVITHEKFCDEYKPEDCSKDLFVRYDTALSELTNKF
ncbi:hypothetical protein [Kiloniella antarctica]|uniref:Tetratricopeptide repeat protein n=1 Tax=Kiloniella antarctica TaxID=1550907 RepID=A0ABW5BN30_9PROT